MTPSARTVRPGRGTLAWRRCIAPPHGAVAWRRRLLFGHAGAPGPCDAALPPRGPCSARLAPGLLPSFPPVPPLPPPPSWARSLRWHAGAARAAGGRRRQGRGQEGRPRGGRVALVHRRRRRRRLAAVRPRGAGVNECAARASFGHPSPLGGRRGANPLTALGPARQVDCDTRRAPPGAAGGRGAGAARGGGGETSNRGAMRPRACRCSCQCHCTRGAVWHAYGLPSTHSAH
jgi:hypothetical protein